MRARKIASVGLRAQSASSAQFAKACSFPELSYNTRGLEKLTGKHLCGSFLLKKDSSTGVIL